MAKHNTQLLFCIRVLFTYYDGNLYWNDTGKIAGYKAPGRYCYTRVNLGGRMYLLHRLIFLMVNGYLPDLIDHVDRDPGNNRAGNLRESNLQQNAINTGLPSNNKSGHKGVRFDKVRGKWKAEIKVNQKLHYLGRFEHKEDAINARLNAEEEFWQIKR